MSGEKNLATLIKNMEPVLHQGEFVFCNVENLDNIDIKELACLFRETEGVTIIVSKNYADRHKLNYSFIASWITLTIHSSLDAVGLTAAFSKALAEENISCNVVAAYFHDHIFVNHADATKAILVLQSLSNS
jgi:uncharacterized protein